MSLGRSFRFEINMGTETKVRAKGKARAKHGDGNKRTVPIASQFHSPARAAPRIIMAPGNAAALSCSFRRTVEKNRAETGTM